MGDPVPLKISVTGTKDISDLLITLHTGADITIDGPQTWENYVSSPSIAPGYGYWSFAIKAGQTLTFNRVLHFPSEEGYFDVNAEVSNPGAVLVGTDSFMVLLTKDGGVVAKEGTALPPHTPNITAAYYGPGTPVPTRLRSSPNPSMATLLPGGNTPIPLVATSTAQTTPYPPPPTTTPIGTPTTTTTLHPYP